MKHSKPRSGRTSMRRMCMSTGCRETWRERNWALDTVPTCKCLVIMSHFITLWKSTLISLVNSWFKFWALLSGISSLFPFVSSPRKRYRESTAVESESSADDAHPFDTSMEIDEWDHMEIKPSAGWVIVQIESLWITQSKSKPIISLY